MDIFYKIPKRKVEQIMVDSHNLAFNKFYERKNEAYVRVKYDITFDEIMRIFKKAGKQMYWVFIKRNLSAFSVECDYYEIGGCTMNGPRDYFMFLHLTEEDGDKLIEKYKLKKL